MRIVCDNYTTGKDCLDDFCERFLSFLRNNKGSKQIWAVRQLKNENVPPFNSGIACTVRRVQLQPFSTSIKHKAIG